MPPAEAANYDEIIVAIRQAIARRHGLQAYAVVLIAKGGLSHTTNGKIHRGRCREAFLAGTLPALASSLLETRPGGDDSAFAFERDQLFTADGGIVLPQLEAALLGLVAHRLGVDPSMLDARSSLAALGLDSLMVIELARQLAALLDIPVSPVDLLPASSVADLARHLGEALAHKREKAPELLLEPAPYPVGTPLPLSFSQQRMWFLSQLVPLNPFYNTTAAWHMDGMLDVEALEKSLNILVQRQHSLRTAFHTQANGMPAQVVTPFEPFSLTSIDLRAYTGSEQDAEVRTLIHEQTRQPFDLACAPLWRVVLLQLAERSWLLALTMHHIISDAWSLGVFQSELISCYQAFSAGKDPRLIPLPLQYGDFAYWQQRTAGEHLEEQVREHCMQLRDLPTLTLPTDHPRPAIQHYHGASYYASIDATSVSALRRLSRDEGMTLFMTLLAAFQILLSRYSGQEDIVVGSLVASRSHKALEDLIGFFASTLVLRTDLAGNPTLREALRRVHESCLEAYVYQDVPFERLVEALQPERDLSRHPLFQVVFQLMASDPMPQVALPNLRIEPRDVASETARFDLIFSLVESAGRIKVMVEYDTDLFERETIARMVEHYQALLQALVSTAPEQPLATLPMLSSEEREQLLYEWGRGTAQQPLERATLPQLFEAQVARDPDAIAAVENGRQLTYGELNARANRLAARLETPGVGPGVAVGLHMERSLEMIVGILAVLKARGIYVPLDTNAPVERLHLMLEEVEARVLLTRSRARLASLSALPLIHLPLDLNELDLDQEGTEHPQSVVGTTPGEAEAAACILYTSGSTGAPGES